MSYLIRNLFWFGVALTVSFTLFDIIQSHKKDQVEVNINDTIAIMLIFLVGFILFMSVLLNNSKLKSFVSCKLAIKINFWILYYGDIDSVKKDKAKFKAGILSPIDIIFFIINTFLPWSCSFCENLLSELNVVLTEWP